jgi:hypothetical protein
LPNDSQRAGEKKGLQMLSPKLIIFVSAELIFLLVKSREIQIIAKRKSQRTSSEQREVDRGLVRAILLELLLFVPVSATLILLITPLILTDSRLSRINSPLALYALLGILSYGFPFAAVRRLITQIAMKTLREFASIAIKETREQESE